jgi:hypothetical protein
MRGDDCVAVIARRPEPDAAIQTPLSALRPLDCFAPLLAMTILSAHNMR